MKNILKISVFVLLATFILSNCSDDFLQEVPKDETYADNLFTDYNGFKLAKNALLNFPRIERSDAIQSAELGVIWKIGTDVAWANTELSWTRGLNRYTDADLNSTMQFLNGDVSDSNKPGIFLRLYRAISSANLIISRANNPDVNWLGGNAEQNEINKNEMIAHARLIRAWSYRHLVMTFGGVPLNLTEITGENYKTDWIRASVTEVQDVIEQDLLFAEEWLPDNSDDVTRLSSAIASHFLADLYLWQGRNAEAEAHARLVVDNPNYKLITERYGVKSGLPGNAFMDQFYQGNILPAQGNTEALWLLPNTTVDQALGQYQNSMRRTWVPSYYNLNVPINVENGGRGIGRAAITAFVFSLYEPTDDRYSEYAVRKKYITNTGSTIITQTDSMQMTTNNHRWASTRKWDWTYDDPLKSGQFYSFADQAYLRLSDTYLLLAEALHMQGKNSETDGAAYWINQVRIRSKATPITAGQVTLDYILDERARELVTEENRRETLMRTGKLLERTRKYNRIAAGRRDKVPGMQPFHELLPIPQRVIETNTGAVIEQNPGYN